MPRLKTKPEDIRDKEHYVHAWLRYEKLNFYKKQAIIKEFEVSIEQSLENDMGFEYKIAINKNGELFTYDYENEFSSSNEWINNMENDGLRYALNRLTKHQREILFLMFCKDLPQVKISEILGITPAAVSIQLKRIIVAIRKQYEIFV